MRIIELPGVRDFDDDPHDPAGAARPCTPGRLLVLSEVEARRAFVRSIAAARSAETPLLWAA